MNLFLLKSVVVAFALVSFVPVSEADDGFLTDGEKMVVVPIENEPGLTAFAEAYVAAINARDAKRVAALCHPKDLAAFKRYLANQRVEPGEEKTTLEESLLMQDPVPLPHPPFAVHRYQKGSGVPQPAAFNWPVRPTHLLQFSYEIGPNNTILFMFHVARIKDRWYVVEGVPTPAMIKEMLKDG